MSNLLKAAAALLLLAMGYMLGSLDDSGPGASKERAATGEREVLYWKAPMDPNYRRAEPGKSPMGMDLVPVYADETDDAEEGVVRINPAVVNNLGVRTAEAERSSLSRRIDTVGYVGYDENTVQHIHTRVDGWIERLGVKASGDAVAAGELLFELYSPTLVNAQEEYLAALQSRNPALHQASRERLAALGVTAAQISRLDRERTVTQRIQVAAERNGVVANLGVREGEYVTPTTDIMSIAELERVWVLAEVFERQAGWVSAGQQAEVELDYLPGQRWSGTVDYVYPELDPQTRTLTVRLRFENAATVLRPNMFTRVRIFGTPTAPLVHVPREALIRGGTADRVVLDMGGGHFRAQPVETGIEAGDRVEIRAGVRAGDMVVTSGQFLIDSESNIDTALARLNEAGGEHDSHDEQQGGRSGSSMDHAMHDMPGAARETPAEEAVDHAAHDTPARETSASGAEEMDHSHHDMPASGDPEPPQ